MCVFRWLLSAPTLEAIKQRAEVTAPNELVIRVYGAAGLWPPEALVRQGHAGLEDKLRPLAVLQVRWPKRGQ